MSNCNELIGQPIKYYFGQEENEETNDNNDEVIDDEDWSDDGPSNDLVDKSLPSEEINIPEDD